MLLGSGLLETQLGLEAADLIGLGKPDVLQPYFLKSELPISGVDLVRFPEVGRVLFVHLIDLSLERLILRFVEVDLALKLENFPLLFPLRLL